MRYDFFSGGRFFILLAAAALLVSTARGDTITWTNNGGGFWDVAGNWSPNQVPVAGDAVVITAASAVVYLPGPTPALASLTLTRTLVFTNWNSTLTAAEVNVTSPGQITHVGPVSTNTSSVTNNVRIVCTNFTLGAGASVALGGKGHAGGIFLTTAKGFGPGGGGWVSGAGYGGRGGQYPPYARGGVYGSASAPTDLGSGGGGESGAYGGHGGGAVYIEAASNITVNGSIVADGSDSTLNGSGGGGSGGSILLVCRTLQGNGGVIRAAGGKGAYGGGGGGRVAVLYDTNAQSQVAVPDIRYSVAGGYGSLVTYYGYWELSHSELGTLYFSDNRFLVEPMPHSGQWLSPGFTNWAANSLTLTSAWLRFPAGCSVYITNGVAVFGTNSLNLRNCLDLRSNTFYCGGNLAITNAAIVMLRQAALACGGSLMATNSRLLLWEPGATGATLQCGGDLDLLYGSTMQVYSAQTNAALTNCGALVTAGGAINVRSNAVIYPSAYVLSLNGGAPLFRCRDFTVAAGASVSGQTLGYAGSNLGSGPGAGSYFSGGSHGGRGGTNYNYPSYTSGPIYGNSNAPVQPGSGGGGANSPAAYGGNGGSVIRIEAQGTITVDGTLTVKGGDGSGDTYGGGGAGGSINLVCQHFRGSADGVIQASGGNMVAGGQAGGGGGGRIRIKRVPAWHTFAGFIAVTGGVGMAGGNGGDGTLVLEEADPIRIGTFFQFQ